MRKSFHSQLLVFALAIAFLGSFNMYAQETTASAGPIPMIKGDRTHTQYGTGENAVIGYGHESQSTSTISMPIPAGTPFTTLNTFVPPGGGFASSMVKGGDGTYYLTTNAPSLYQFDPTTGAVTLLGAITGMAGQTPNGIGYNSANSTYYLASSSSLFSFDVTTRVATLIGAFGVAGGLMIDLCFDAAGTCYAYDLGVDNAYTINLTTGAATLLGPLGYDANFGQGMDYDYETSTIYLSAFNNGSFSGQLRTMDPTTGMTTLVVDWGLQQVAPFALDTSPGLPCPLGGPTNPSPAPGTTNVPITGNSVSWTNSAGTTMNEVYFNGNLVYDGPAITSYSLAPHEPLNYSTTYSWRVVCKDATCGTTGPSWTFTTMANPLLLDLFFDDFESGLAQWTVTNDGGTCVWEIFTPPYPNAYTLPATSSGGVLAADSDECGSGTTMLTTAKVTSPINAAGVTDLVLEFDNDFRILDADDHSYVEVSTDGGTTWQIVWSAIGVAVRSTHEIVDLSAYDGMTFEIRFRSVQPGWDWWWVVDNVLIQGVIPVELTSFTAATVNQDVVLNWSTATEINNMGFDIERGVNGEFTKVGFAAGHGTTTETKNYTFTDRNVANGTYSYRLRQVDFDGTFEYSPVVEVVVDVPSTFSLSQNYPNPFNPSTTITFGLAVDSKVSLKIFDVLGQEVAILVNGDLGAGNHNINFNASGLNSGVYFYTIEAKGIDGNTFMNTKKMILTK
jgi:hypothetical protein